MHFIEVITCLHFLQKVFEIMGMIFSEFIVKIIRLQFFRSKIQQKNAIANICAFLLYLLLQYLCNGAIEEKRETKE